MVEEIECAKEMAEEANSKFLPKCYIVTREIFDTKSTTKGMVEVLRTGSCSQR